MTSAKIEFDSLLQTGRDLQVRPRSQPGSQFRQGVDYGVFGLWQNFHYVLNIVTSWQVYPVLSLAVELISM